MSQDILNVYDHEVKQLIELSAELTEKARTRKLNYNDFEREIRDRFAKLGFLVDINWYTYSIDGIEQAGSALPEVTVKARTDDKFQFDHDRQVHEAVANVLEIPGEEGWISTDKDTLKRFLDDQKGHGHGHGHH